MDLLQELQNYQPINQQEEQDKALMLRYLERNADCLTRENVVAHFTASLWTVNPEHTKTLMVYHNIYHSWSWIGGHADGEEDLCSVAFRELQEETGVKNAVLASKGIFSLEVLTVNGHIKKGLYVPSHLHLNVTYLAEASEREKLAANPEENQGVRWLPIDEALTAPEESWMVEWVYRKLVEKTPR